jgi:hypothetical protein
VKDIFDNIIATCEIINKKAVREALDHMSMPMPVLSRWSLQIRHAKWRMWRMSAILTCYWRM